MSAVENEVRPQGEVEPDNAVFTEANILWMSVKEWAEATGKDPRQYALEGIISAKHEDIRSCISSLVKKIINTTIDCPEVILHLTVINYPSGSQYEHSCVSLAGVALIPKKKEDAFKND